VMLSHSADGGRTWSPARRVSDDGEGQTDDHPLDSVNPSVAVNAKGVVGVLWYDRRDNADFGYWPRFAASLDGGETWTASVRVSSHPMRARLDGLFAYTSPRTVDGAATHELVFSVHNGWNFKSGDTSGLVADSAGNFHPVWIDNRSGWSQIWTAPVRVDGNLRALQDATTSTSVRLANVRYDSTTRTVSADATVTATAALRGPLVLQVIDLTSGIADRVTAAGTSNGIHGVGAAWEVADSSARLAPGNSVTHPLRFTFDQWSRAAINPLAVNLRVLTGR